MLQRRTHRYQGDLALFLIGMRVHQPWHLRQVARTFAAMPKMIAELERNRAAADRGEASDLGYLGARTVIDGFGATVIQYWRSVEQVYAYAADPDLAHRPAWLAFHKAAKAAPNAVTIWHETYAVPAGGHESIYGGPVTLGLGRIDGVEPVAHRGERAAQRMQAHRSA